MVNICRLFLDNMISIKKTLMVFAENYVLITQCMKVKLMKVKRMDLVEW